MENKILTEAKRKEEKEMIFASIFLIQLELNLGTTILDIDKKKNVISFSEAKLVTRV